MAKGFGIKKYFTKTVPGIGPKARCIRQHN
jgi:hypothetical protein